MKIKNVTINGDSASIAATDFTATRGSLKGFIESGSPPTKLTKQSDGSWKLSG